MSKQLTNLIEKALAKGYANVNGHKPYIYGSGYHADLESKYRMDYDKKTEVFVVSHWDMTILRINLKVSRVISHYGQSMSDRNAIQFILNYFNLPYKATYKKDIMEVTLDKTY